MAPAAPAPAGEHTPPQGHPGPWCSRCGTDEYLLIESVEESSTRPGQFLEVSYTRLECEGFCAHEVPVTSLTPEIVHEYTGRPLPDPPGHSLHCGGAMALASPAGQATTPRPGTDPGEKHRLEVYLRTRVLHCRYGFQIESSARTGPSRRREGFAPAREGLWPPCLSPGPR